MTKSEIAGLAEAFASILLSHATHGLATSSLDATGEITLRDGLIVGAAAFGARLKQAWILEREIVPAGWDDANVDVIISRRGHRKFHPIVGVELKWWRRSDAANSGNRRRDLLKDFLRAGALYTRVEAVSFVALLSTRGAWDATTGTSGSDATAMRMLSENTVQKWNVTKMIRCRALRRAVEELKGRVPICSIFHTELISNCSFLNSGRETVSARVWTVKKPQKTCFLDEADSVELVG